jgi:uncharacterized protein (DUF433 family)
MLAVGINPLPSLSLHTDYSIDLNGFDVHIQTVKFNIATATSLVCQRYPSVRMKQAEAIFQYWIKKRKKIRKALMRPYQLPPAVENSSPHIAFRPRFSGRRISTRNVIAPIRSSIPSFVASFSFFY